MKIKSMRLLSLLALWLVAAAWGMAVASAAQSSGTVGYGAVMDGETAEVAEDVTEDETEALSALLSRIGGEGAKDLVELKVDTSLGDGTDGGEETFVICSEDSKPCIKGSTLSAVTAGLGWYLNHYARINLSWNNLTTDLTAVSLPTPSTEEKHTSTAECRYYLNYCTFSYSMAFWTWERWEQEIDWMALHGVNMPLMLVGTDVVWRNALKELSYTDDEIASFIAGPGFQAWWLMNNLMGWGGANPDWWYTRQETLAGKILARMRELGMEPVLPGYSGMVPADVSTKLGWTITDPGTWCGFSRPGFLDPSSENFATMAKLYYEKLTTLMGTSAYYSMDPFHEGGNTTGVDLTKAYTAIVEAMNECNPDATWVIQSWNENPRTECLSTVDKGKLLVLDLFSDGVPKWQEGYQGHDFVYCMLHNFGGRVGMHGRLKQTIKGYYDALSQASSQLKGIGATPEGIETNPILYDALFELPWRDACDADEWRQEYVASRYGSDTPPSEALEAWQLIANSALDCQTSQQGTSEPVICARPSLNVQSVSSWSTSTIYYDTEDIVKAAALLLSLKGQLSGDNFDYDLCDVVRQAITDRANSLLKQVNAAYTSGQTERYETLRDMFLGLILDQDKLLSTIPQLRLGRWTQMARSVADEVTGTSTSDKDWMEWNARTLITVWGTEAAASSLHDYSNREWAGLLKDFHYERWKRFFDALDEGKSLSDWYAWENAWTEAYSTQYSAEAEGETGTVVAELFPKYFTTFGSSDVGTRYIAYASEHDLSGAYVERVLRGTAYTCTIDTEKEATLSVDFNNDGTFSDDETSESLTINVPSTAASTRVKANLTLADLTSVTFTLILADSVTQARKVTVMSEDSSRGTASIGEGGETEVTTTEEVELVATAADGYEFLSWTDGEGNVVSTDNPMYYYGKEAQTFTAHFVEDKWTRPETDLSEWSTIESYGQYVSQMTASQVDVDPYVFYTASACPEELYIVVPQMLSAARGSSLNISWTDPNNYGLSYCRLSAYIDLNSDGDFDDVDELIDVIGTINAQNYSVCSGTLQILLPYDMPTGLTHIRMRFDGAWTDGWDSKTTAKPADAKTVRMVYEIRLNVTELPSTECTVTVVSSDEEKGTAVISGHAESATVSPGESVTLQAQPATGYVLKEWTDQYGRVVSTENNYQLTPAESGTFTAVFAKELPDYLTIGAWTLTFAATDEGELTLTGAVSGSGELIVPEYYTYDGASYPIVALSQGFLQNNQGLTRFEVGSSLSDLGTGVMMKDETYSWTGDGTSNKLISLDTTLNADGDWSLLMDVTTDGSTFNQWGSGLLATGTDALADSYPSGFQLYLSAAGNVVVKCGSTEVKTFTLTQSSTSFSIELQHMASGSWSLTVTNASGNTETYSTSTYTLANISQFSSSLPVGVNVVSLVLETPHGETQPLFAGCSNLTAINADAANLSFASLDGVLYTADYSQMLRCPEGLLTREVVLPSACEAVGTYALNGVEGVERLVADEALTEVDPTAFTSSSTFLEVTPTVCKDYASKWDAKLLVSVAETESVDASLLGGATAVEIEGDDEFTGSLTSDLTSALRWYTRTFEASQGSALFFPAEVDSVVVLTQDGTLDVVDNVTEAFAICQYDAQEGAFALTSLTGGKTLPAGAYLLLPAKTMVGSTLTFKMGASNETALPSSEFTGNGSLAGVAIGSGAYTYSPEANLFLPLTGDAEASPFEAYFLTDADPLPENFPGIPDELTGIGAAKALGGGEVKVMVVGRRIVVSGDSNYTVYDTTGRRMPQGEQLGRGVYVVSHKQGCTKVLVK